MSTDGMPASAGPDAPSSTMNSSSSSNPITISRRPRARESSGDGSPFKRPRLGDQDPVTASATAPTSKESHYTSRPRVVRVRGLLSMDPGEAKIMLRGMIDQQLQASEQGCDPQITIVPACDDENQLAALVDFPRGLPSFLTDLEDDAHSSELLPISDSDGDLSFDRHFLGFTQLYNNDPLQEIAADIIALSGIGGHAYGSWQSKGRTPRMWLRHFMSKDFPNCRTMIYGYDAKLTVRSIAKTGDFSQRFLQDLKLVRHEEPSTSYDCVIWPEQRPLILIAHSFGGIIVARSLIEAAKRSSQKNFSPELSFYLATYGMLFFAVPHRGIDVDDMLYVLDKDSPLTRLLEEIRSQSKELKVQLEDFKQQIHERKVVSFPETKQSRRLQMSQGKLGRTGNYYTGLEIDDAILDLPNEQLIHLDGDHSSLVKFTNAHDLGYKHTLRILKAFLNDAPATIKQRFFRTFNTDSNTRFGSAAGIEDPHKRAREAKVENLLRELYTCPYHDRKDRNRPRVDGTCEWFTNHDRFKHFKNSEKARLLLVSADPGCGKSVLARYLVDEVLPTGNNTVFYFFFKDDFDDQKNSLDAIRALLRQLFEAKPHLLQDSVLKKHEKDGRRFLESFADLWNTFVTASKDAGEIVCVLDALDECQENDRAQLSRAIIDAQSHSNTLKFLLTFRPIYHIRLEFQELKSRAPEIQLNGEAEPELEKISKEINIVVHHRVEEIGRRCNLEPEECAFLRQELAKVENRTYLWVYLTLDVIESNPSFTRGNVRRSIASVPQTVSDAYEAILQRSTDKKKARKLLHIIAAATRPLSLSEMRLALAIDKGHENLKDVEQEQEPVYLFPKIVREICGLFVVIVGSKLYFIHQTAREFLVSDRHQVLLHGEEDSKWYQSLHTTDSNRLLAEICMLYIHLKDFETCDTPEQVFHVYSARNWGFHLRNACVSVKSSLVDLAIGLSDSTGRRYELWAIELQDRQSQSRLLNRLPESPHPLAVACYYGLNTVVEKLLEQGHEINSHDKSNSWTPLMWAATQGHEATATLIIERNADINLETTDSRDTALHEAVRFRKTTIVKMLLRKGASLELRNKLGYTPMHYAAKGATESLRALIDGGANVNTESEEGQTPLIIAINSLEPWPDDRSSTVNDFEPQAVEKLHRVKLLLESGAEINIADVDGRTSLSYAAGYCNKVEIAEMLLKSKAEVDHRDRLGWTPLMFAARNQRADNTSLLLDWGADVNAQDKTGLSALAWAARAGSATIVTRLLERQAMVNLEDKRGRSPLWWATRGFTDGNVHRSRIILDGLILDARGEIDAEWFEECEIGSTTETDSINEDEAETGNICGEGNSEQAIQSTNQPENRDGGSVNQSMDQNHDGHGEEMQDSIGNDMDETEGESNGNSSKEAGEAQQDQRMAIVRMLLKKGANVNAGDGTGQTPLWWAKHHGLWAIATLLRGNGGKSKNSAQRGSPKSRDRSNFFGVV